MRLCGAVLGALAICAVAVPLPAAAKSVALVIGIDQYDNLPKLEKAVNDAEAVAKAMHEIGFDKIVRGVDLTRRKMNRKLSEFMDAIQPGDRAFLFFAGHGVAIDGENYIIPRDMPMPRLGETGLVKDEAHAVSALIERVQRRGATPALFVLDACRDNPFQAVGVRSIGSTRGIARMAAPTGVFVLFSAGIGQKALDRLPDGDKNPNSVFTRNLLPLLKQRGLTHVRLAKLVQQRVSRLAASVQHRQEPAYYDQIIGEIVLRPGDEPEESKTPKGPVSSAARFWESIKDTKSPAMLKVFIAKFPDSLFAEFAKARLQELEGDKVTRLPTENTGRKAPDGPKSTDSVDDGSLVSCSFRSRHLERSVTATMSRSECRRLAGDVRYSQ